MKFRAHDTFFIRKGWLSKGMKNIARSEYLFTNKEINPMDVLGIGANMVKSMRYWLQAVGITYENTSGQRKQNFTEVGKIIYENDPFTEELGTLCILHYKLAKSVNTATSWYYFFNKFNLSEFSKEDFVSSLLNYINLQGIEVAKTSLEDDFNCIVNTYVPRSRLNPEKVQPESNIDCPLGELGLINIANRKDKLYKKTTPQKSAIDPLIFLSIIIDNAKDEKEIALSTLQFQDGNVGKIFNLDAITLINMLSTIESLGYIKVIRTAGLDVVRIITDFTFVDCIAGYYSNINK